MSENKALLTIDDCPSKDFERKLDFLIDKKIPAIFFCQGNLIDADIGSIKKAIKNGYAIGNHAFSHKTFSDLPIDLCYSEIAKTDELINNIYESCGIRDYKKYFRFAYGDVGDFKYGFNLSSFEDAYLRKQGKQQKVRYTLLRTFFNKRYTSRLNRLQKEGKFRKNKIQSMLKDLNYTQAEINIVKYHFFQDFKSAYDWSWTFDIMEWKLLNERNSDDGFSLLVKRLNSDHPKDERGIIREPHGLNYMGSGEIILLHDHERTGAFFGKIIDHLEKKKVNFVHPDEALA